jgi:hypothetical protein
MADTYAQAISMIADWLPFLVTAPAVTPTAAASASAGPAPTKTAWDDDTFDGWAEDETAVEDTDAAEPPINEGEDEGENLFGEEDLEEEAPAVGDDDLSGFDIEKVEEKPAPAKPPKKQPADEDDWLAGISQ